MRLSAVTRRRHAAADGRTHADDAGAATHDASPSPHDDAGPAGHDATGQIRPAGRSPLSVATNRHCLVRTLGLTLGFFIAPFLNLYNVRLLQPQT